jgi:glutathione synthase/RimK-type ligase-like ATP-grasp enzyme
MATAGLCRELLLRPKVIYQMRETAGQVEFGPLIGLLLGHQTHRYSPRYMGKFSDRMTAAQKTGGLVCAFSPQTVDWDQKIAWGLIFDQERSSWEFDIFPLPRVIYRRSFHLRPGEVDKLRDAGTNMFNSRRFLKPEVYDIVDSDKGLQKYIPPTLLVEAYPQLKKFIDDYQTVILKPTDLSRGRGICFVDRRGSTYFISDYRGRLPVEAHVRGEAGLREYFARNSGFFKRYLAQKVLSLAQVDGRLFNIRVVMQKSIKGRWRCSGIECRVGGPGMRVTNISRGGMAMQLDEALERAFGAGDHRRAVREIHDAAARVCAAMDRTGEHFAEFGLDLGLDTGGRLWLIEVNVFPSFKGFKLMDPPAYVRIRQAPLLYASTVAGFPPGR